jgi:hypothetical protein
VEDIFKKYACDKMLREIPLWIKAFFMEEGMIPIPSTEMAILNTYTWGRVILG